MDLRQLQIEELVTQYFRSRPDVTWEVGSNGQFSLTLQSTHAITQFGGKEHVCVTFDADIKFQNPEWELINATHPYLEVIRNDLASTETEDPRLSEAHFSPQPIGPEGCITVPQINLAGPILNVGYEINYLPYFVLTYKVVFESDERQDYVLRLCFNARSGESRNDIVRHLTKLPLEEGRPSSVRERGHLFSLAEVLKRGRLEIEQRVRVEVVAIAGQFSEQLTKEKERLEKHYQRETDLTNKRDEVGRQRLSENLKKEIEDFEKKYAFRSRTYLISALLLWAPDLLYSIQASGSTAAFFVDGISYDSGADVVNFQICPECGNQRQFAICCAGRHAFCGLTDCGIRAVCVACGDLYCATHGDECSRCGASSCFMHRGQCAYGPHPATTGFCRSCLKLSFEKRIICGDCATKCELCSRTFPQDMVESCYVDNERFCFGHDQKVDGDFCSECTNPVCQKHARKVGDDDWACLNHSHEASCCHRVFGNSHLSSCVEDRSELLCEIHRLKCAVGAEAICENHVIKSWQGESLCAPHSASCVRCTEQSVQRVHRSDQLAQCVICLGKVCKEHHRGCDVCLRTRFCTAHEWEQPTCSSCSRVSCTANGCSVESSTCKLCKMSYCRHCLTSKGVCTTCANPDPGGRASVAFPLLEALRAERDEDLKKAAETMVKSFVKCSVLSSENHTYRIVRVHFKPSQWKVWQKEIKLRIVAKRDGGVVKALLERTQ